jgi:hypothetical protein
MTVIGKAVTEAVHGKPPTYSYFQGTSGGGRQTMMQAQRYPEDYDGMWASEAAINYPRLAAACLWPPLVMKEHNNPLSAAKMRAFRDAATSALADGTEVVDGTLEVFNGWKFNASDIVGQVTEAGIITDVDALVMQKIWDGPTAGDGTRLWYGYPASTETWGDNLFGNGVAITAEVDGILSPVPFVMSPAFIGAWILREPGWDWSTLTFDNFEEAFRRGVKEFDELATDDPDLSGLRDSGHKLIISQGINDEIITPWGMLDYYRRVLDHMSGVEGVDEYIRLFVGAGDAHSHITRGPGISLSAGMSALMEWVENGVAPEMIMGEQFDPAEGRTTLTRPIYAYPYVARYDGVGDPTVPASFERVLLSEPLSDPLPK